MSRKRIAIIGAGLAGVTLAQRLHKYAEVLIVEKSRGAGGRMATRHRESGSFDHGAQYFTVRDAGFHALLEPALDAGIVEAWSTPLHRMSASGALERLEDRSPRFVAVPRMTSLVKWLAKPLNVQLETRVTALEGKVGSWKIDCDQGSVDGTFDWVISAAPAPQTANLLPLDPADQEAVEAVRMNGCFTLMLELKPDIALPFAAAQVQHPFISWIALNTTKPGRDDGNHLVVHASNQWSDANLEEPPEQVQARMIASLEELVPNLKNAYVTPPVLHRWRYANVETPLGRPFLLDADRHIAACGDWCIGNRVESAFLSANALADALLAQMSEETA